MLDARTNTPTILSINTGSSSIRFALYEQTAELRCVLHGLIERIGLPGTTMRSAIGDASTQTEQLPQADHAAAVAILLEWLKEHGAADALQLVGHRIVYGMEHAEPQHIAASLLEQLRAAQALAPGHLPGALAAIDALRQALPALPQIACFDCDFHSGMPRIASLLSIPQHLQALGLRRYGFHGLSYAWLMRELIRLGDPAAQRGRVILAHLGNGASLCAVRDGRSIDTTMGLTPASGIVMSSRSGDLDPTLAHHLAQRAGINAGQFQHMVNHQSGLLGISALSSDMRDLLRAQSSNSAAADAVGLFCYQVKKTLGAYAAALGGLDTLVFSGGIGQHAAEIRERCCAGLEFLGITLDANANAQHCAVVSSKNSTVRVRVIATDETRMIAQLAQQLCTTRSATP